MIGGDLDTFVNGKSMMIVGGGTLAATLITFPLRDLLGAFGAAGRVLVSRRVDPNNVVETMVRLAHFSRRQGLLGLAKIKTDSPVLKKGLNLIADGADEDLIRHTLRIEIDSLKHRHFLNQDVFKKMGAYSPAFGMLGTLIGLVQMLRHLDNPKTIGPAMAVALITTFYGSLMATLFFLPIAGKLRVRTSLEIINLEIVFEGAIGILENNNPMFIFEKLSSFIPPRLRHEYDRALTGGLAGETAGGGGP